MITRVITRQRLIEARNAGFLKIAASWKEQVAQVVDNLEKNLIEAAEQGRCQYTLITIPPEIEDYFICRQYAREEFRKVISPEISISEEPGRLIIYW